MHGRGRGRGGGPMSFSHGHGGIPPDDRARDKTMRSIFGKSHLNYSAGYKITWHVCSI